MTSSDAYHINTGANQTFLIAPPIADTACTTSTATALTSCASQWVKVPRSVQQMPTLPTHFSRNGSSIPIPFGEGFDPNTLEFFTLQNKQYKTYLSAYYPPRSPGTTTEMVSTSFVAGTTASSTDALICAAIPLEFSLEKSPVLFVWLNEHDNNPKGLCANSGSAVRAYMSPPACFGVEAGGNACEFSWQVCNYTTGFCGDATTVSSKDATVKSPIVQSVSLFPNCAPSTVTESGDNDIPVQLQYVPILHLVPISDSSSTCTAPSTQAATTATDRAHTYEYVRIVGICIAVVCFIVVAVIMIIHTKHVHKHVAVPPPSSMPMNPKAP